MPSTEIGKVVGRRDILVTGSVDRDIRRSERNGELERITRGWYRTGPPVGKLQDAVDRIVAMLRRAPSLVASHESAALLHRLPLVYALLDVVHLTRNARRGARRDPGRIIHARPIDPGDVQEIHGLPVTSIGRTLVDLGCTSPDPRTVIAAADAALQRRMLDPATLAAALAAAGHPSGIARARFLLRFADGRSESAGESVLRWLLAQAGLPDVELQVEVYSAAGIFLGRVDLAYPTAGVVVEFDGRVKYQALLRPGDDVTTVVLAEKAREDKLREAGLIVIRIVWADFADPTGLARRVREALTNGKRSVDAGLVTARLVTTPARRLP